MDDKVKEEIINWIRGLGEFAQAQAPQLANEVVRWNAIDGMITFLTCGAIAIGSLYLFSLSRRYRDEDIGFLGCVIATLAFMFFACAAVNGIEEVAKSNFAPRVVIMEELR